ncbi:Yos1-like protein [Daldinia caldariorum]|uniref:Yos1-like protein n=1 Tax=Daldinia caldariorum TaxID=326644 RepID=UPI002008049A|nr:Yos1-like protein [Daldinia caldariorum]KAI1465687.1 Yos1-like protein [Daldinia caldariorum]
MLLFGNLFYVSVLLINAITILSQDRFLARLNLSSYDPAFGAGPDAQSMQAKVVNLISSVRTVTRIPLIGVNLMIIIYELAFG